LYGCCIGVVNLTFSLFHIHVKGWCAMQVVNLLKPKVNSNYEINVTYKKRHYI
jgi:hypothetical protein